MILFLVVAAFVAAAAAATDVEERGIVCPPGIKRISYNDDPTKYWECLEAGERAYLRSCPEGRRYHRKSSRCIKTARLTKRSESDTEVDPDQEVLLVENIGSHVGLGQAYDARHETLLPGQYAWLKKTMEGKKETSPLKYSHMDVFQEQNVNDRTYNMNIQARLKLGFLSGLIQVEGTAKYLRDEKSSSNVARVTMSYRSTISSETIPVNVGIDNKKLCMSSATHIVTAVVYGHRAIFNFDKVVGRTETTEEIGGSLEVEINAIPTLTIKGKAAIDIKGNVVKEIDNLSVRYFGDILIGSPQSYLEACLAFSKIPDKSSDNGVIIKYQLTPIQYLNCGGKPLFDVGPDKTEIAIGVLTALAQTQLKTTALIDATQITEIKSVLNKFETALQNFTIIQKDEIKKILPLLRSGEKTEVDLLEIVNKYTDSCFETGRSDLFLALRAREINTIELVIGEARGSSLYEITDEDNNDQNECLLNSEYATTYNLNVLPVKNVAEEFLKSKEATDESGAWYNDLEKVGKAGGKLVEFFRFGKVNSKKDHHCFLINVLRLDAGTSDDYISMAYYAEGKKITNKFEVPNTPPTPICRPQYKGFELITRVSENAFVEKHVVMTSHREGNTTIDDDPTLNNDVDPIFATGLEPHSKYTISTKYRVFEYADSGFSETSATVECTTAPSTLVKDLSVPTSTKSSLTMTWVVPDEIYPPIADKLQYVLKVLKEGAHEDETLIFKTKAPVSTPVRALEPATSYMISVHTATEDSYSLPIELEFATSPGAIPSPEMTGIIDGTSAGLVMKMSVLTQSWSKLLETKTLVVTYYEVDKTEKRMEDTVKTINEDLLGARTDKDFAIVSLEEGKTYGVTVRIVVTIGNRDTTSDTSGQLLVTTPYEGTEAEKLTKQLNATQTATDSKITGLNEIKEEQDTTIDDMNSRAEELYKAASGSLDVMTSEANSNFTQTEGILKDLAAGACVDQGYAYSDPTKTISATNMYQCYTACSKVTSCKAVTFKPKKSSCALNSARRGTMAYILQDSYSINKVCRGALGGSHSNWMECVKEETEFAGSDLTSSTGLYSLNDCVAWCVNTRYCESVSYNKSQNKCSLKNKSEGTAVKANTALTSVSLNCLRG